MPHLGTVGWAGASVAAARRIVKTEGCILGGLWWVEVFVVGLDGLDS